MTANTELYYAEMEAARNEAEDAYFQARPQADCIANRTLFRAGFERAYQKLYWTMRPIPALPSVAPVPGQYGTGQVAMDCGCPINTVCMNVACPRRTTFVSCSVGKSGDQT